MLAVANEPHEITNIQYFASKGAAKYVGFRNEWNDKAFSDTASVICTSAKIREDMHRSGLKLVDGKGLQRVSKILVDLTDIWRRALLTHNTVSH
jgi:spore coat polysaccharide biosynthesis predicted glycosyltransferase SpsG